MNTPYAPTVRAIIANNKLTDLSLNIHGRELYMLGPAGPARELGILPNEQAFPDPGDEQERIPVLIGSGMGAALEEAVKRLQLAYGNDFFLVVIDKEEAIMAETGVRERFSQYSGIRWVTAATSEEAIRELTELQAEYGGKVLRPLLNPFYLRIDRLYYNEVNLACEASARANFWEKAHYPKFRQAQPRLLLLTSQYFLMGEIISACQRLVLPHRLLQMPDGEMGKKDFVKKLLTAVLEFKPDFVFTINHLGVDREGVLTDLLERLRLPLASWFVDNPHLILYLYTNLVSPWTSIFTWDADNVESLKDMGFSHVSYLPLGVDTTRFKPARKQISKARLKLPSAWDRNISFVGNSMLYKVKQRLERSIIPPSLAAAYPTIAEGFAESSERSAKNYLAKSHPEYLPAFDAMIDDEERLNYETLLTWEATLQYRLSCIKGILPYHPLIAGDQGWKTVMPKRTVWHHMPELNYYEELPRFYPCASINFNCTSKQMKGAVNQRVFDVPATESFLLTDYREQVENLFEPGKEIICYHSPEEAHELAGEYLKRPVERMNIAKAARKRILNEHSYEHRIMALVAKMKEIYA